MPTSPAHGQDEPFDRAALTGLLLRLIGGWLLLVLIVGVLGYAARDQCEAIARRFVATFGYGGMALGTLLADGAHFPVPPQFYLFFAVASEAHLGWALLAITGASLLAGGLDFLLARSAAELGWIARRTQRSRRLFASAFARFGLPAVLVANVLPIPFSVLCYIAGINRMPRSVLLTLFACRIPKLAGFLYLIRLGWLGS